MRLSTIPHNRNHLPHTIQYRFLIHDPPPSTPYTKRPPRPTTPGTSPAGPLVKPRQDSTPKIPPSRTTTETHSRFQPYHSSLTNEIPSLHQHPYSLGMTVE